MSAEYKVISNKKLKDFQNDVIEALNDGWMLEGGVSVTTSGGSWQEFNYHQALSK